MSDLPPIPSSISHKKLNALRLKAYKEVTSYGTSINQSSEDQEKFNDLIKTWSELNTEILSQLNMKKGYITKGKSPDSLMALGAMEVHLNMAMQALKAYER